MRDANDGDGQLLAYESLDGQWAQWFRTAQRFEHKVPQQDRQDIRHSIILELALARARDGDKPFSEALMYRIASFVVADYWRKQRPAISLCQRIEGKDGESRELSEALADDRALDLDAWVDARTWLRGCPRRLLSIAEKEGKGIALDNAEYLYLSRWRKREQLSLVKN